MPLSVRTIYKIKKLSKLKIKNSKIRPTARRLKSLPSFSSVDFAAVSLQGYKVPLYLSNENNESERGRKCCILAQYF